MVSVSINIKDTMSPVVRAMAAGCKDFHVPLQTAGLYLQKSISNQFAVGGKPKWKPLAAITIFYRRGHSDKPLLDTGRLRRSYISRSGGDSTWNLNNARLIFGSNLNYAALHQYGGESILHEKRWFKSGRKRKDGTRTPDRQVDNIRISSKTGKPIGVKLKYIKSYITIRVPARPLSIQPEDVEAIKVIFERYIMRKAHGR